MGAGFGCRLSNSLALGLGIGLYLGLECFHCLFFRLSKSIRLHRHHAAGLRLRKCFCL